MKIKKFFEFKSIVDQDILYIFDFDDTLVVSPDFEEKAIHYINENLTVRDLLKKCLDEIGIDKELLKYEDGRLFFKNPSFVLPNNCKYWVKKGDRIYLIAPNIYSTIDESLPKETLELKTLYNSVENKCIVTARPLVIKDKIEKVLDNLGFEKPNYGLHMYPHLNYRNAGTWKGEKIVEILKNSDFDRAIFYDDNSKYIKKAKKVITEKLPNFDIKYVKV